MQRAAVIVINNIMQYCHLMNAHTEFNLPLIHPDRPKPRIRPFKAIHHFNKLVADKEDTNQVFEIIDNLDGKTLSRHFKKFAQTQGGRARIAERRYLPPILDGRRAEFLQMPEGSLGRVYAEFMQSEGLTAQGLVDESEMRMRGKRYDDIIQWFAERLRDTHDMFHVLSGYGRDALGEATLLGFSQRQSHKLGRGVIFIHYMGGRQIAKYAPRGVDIKAVLREGRQLGVRADKIVEQDLLSMLELPIDQVRKDLNIGEPVLYKQALDVFRCEGMEPATA